MQLCLTLFELEDHHVWVKWIQRYGPERKRHPLARDDVTLIGNCLPLKVLDNTSHDMAIETM
jgi:hypothetical protein